MHDGETSSQRYKESKTEESQNGNKWRLHQREQEAEMKMKSNQARKLTKCANAHHHGDKHAEE